MNLFEKIFNYQILSRLEESGTFMVTSHERAWLRTVLAHPAAVEAFTASTLEKLHEILLDDPAIDTSQLIEKTRSREKQLYDPLLRPLRKFITAKKGIVITYSLNSGRVCSNQPGLGCKLEYSMVKREWYLMWRHLRHHTFMKTRLEKIHAVSEYDPLPPAEADRILEKFHSTRISGKTEAVIEIVRDYNRELSRVLYALSCFEKDVGYDGDTDTYTVRIVLPEDEREYLLSKLRFLGKRVRVTEGDYLKKRMLEASAKALERYGESLPGE